MEFDSAIVKRANALRVLIQRDPGLPTVDHGESVSILVWWMFLMDHAKTQGLDVKDLAHHQLEAFIDAMADKLSMVLQH